MKYLKKSKMFFLTGIFFFLSVLFTGHSSFGQRQARYTVSGYVKEAGTGESLIGVNVYLPDHKSGTVTNNYGFYSLTMPESDSVTILFSYVGYSVRSFSIPFGRDSELNVDLTQDNLLGEVTISGERKELISESVRMSTVKLQVAQIRNVPALLGEKDVLKVLQLMPGVQKGSEGFSGLYVRGGGPDQNLIILDDAIVYNANHIFGFFSLFNGSALKSVELTKGGFPARYGGRLSSVLEMNMKEGNREEWHGEGGIGLISSNFTIEGPLKKNKSSILLSGRRTYADLIIYPFIKLSGEEMTGYYFYDLNAKVNYDFGNKNKLYLSGYFGKDKFYIKYNSRDGVKENVGFLWGNSTATLRWNHLFSNRLFSNTSMVFSNYSFGIYDKYEFIAENKKYNAEYFSGIRDLTFKTDLDFILNTSHLIKTGMISIFHRFNPHAYIEEDAANQVHIRNFNYINSIESAIYAEDTWQPADEFKVNAGLRYSLLTTEKKFSGFPEPRISAAWKAGPDLAIKSSFATMHQYVHLLSNTGMNLPTDLWVPATARIPAQRSSQFAVGIARDIRKNNLLLSAEAYYKTMDNVTAYKEGASFLDIGEPSDVPPLHWENNITSGHAWSYGLELLIQKKEGRLNGWIGYTLSWTQMQFDSLNSGKKFYARYDRRHDISVVGIWKLNDNITISGTWVYGTGNAISLPLSSYNSDYHNFEGVLGDNEFYSHEFAGRMFYRDNYEYGNRNNFRMKAYHRMDLGISFRKEKKWGERSWEISLYNAYSRLNPFFYYTDIERTEDKDYGIVKQVSLFPIIPSVTYSFKF